MNAQTKTKNHALNSARLPLIIVVGVLTGCILGALWPEGMLSISVIGIWYVKALKLIVAPLVASLLIVSLSSFRNVGGLGHVSLRTLLFFAVTSGVAVIIGLALALLVNPGADVIISPHPLSVDVVPQQLTSIDAFLVSLVPDSFADAFGGTFTLGTVIFFVFLAVVLGRLGSKTRSVTSFFDGLKEALLKILSWLIIVAPVGLGVLAGAAVATARVHGQLNDLVGVLGMLTAVVVAGLAIHGLVVLPLALHLTTSRSVVTFFRNMLPAFMTALGTSSKAATLPICYSCVVERNKVEPRAASFVLPAATVLNMNGSALFMAVATVFVAQATGVSLTVLDVLLLGLASLAVSFAMAGIPQAGLFGVFAVASILGFPQEALAALSTLVVIDWLLDRLRTTINVAGDGVAAAALSVSQVLEFSAVGRERRPTSRDSSRKPHRDSRRAGSRDQLSDKSRPARDRSQADRSSKRQPRERSSGGQPSRTGPSARGPQTGRGPQRGRSDSSPRPKSDRRHDRTDSKPSPPDERGPARERSQMRSAPPPPPSAEPPEHRGIVTDTLLDKKTGETPPSKDKKPETRVARSEDRPDRSKRGPDKVKSSGEEISEPAELELPLGLDVDKRDRNASDTESEGQPQAVSETRSETDSDSDTVDKEEQDVEVSYGRSLNRRGKKHSGKSEDEDQDDKPGIPEELKTSNGFSNEDISFGRTRRKRER